MEEILLQLFLLVTAVSTVNGYRHFLPRNHTYRAYLLFKEMGG